MINKKLLWAGFLNALATIIYISVVAELMANGKKLFGPVNNQIFPAIALLSLFVVSACAVGTLILGRPVLWYLDGKKSEAAKLFLYTLGWLFVFTLAAFCVLAALPKFPMINLQGRA